MNEYRLLKFGDDYLPQVKRWWWPFWCYITDPCCPGLRFSSSDLDAASLICAQHSKGFFHTHFGKM